jgi:hypothetical protein
MASAKQITANRRNARKSSGPKTSRGKSLSKMNALRHGLCAEQVLVPGEDEREFADLRRCLLEDLQPEGGLEVELFYGLVVDFWRLHRLRRVESGLFANGMDLSNASGSSQSCDAGHDSELQRELGQAFSNYYAPRVFGCLSRYEASLTRSIHRAINKLLELQAARREQLPINSNNGDGGERLPLPANET